MQSKIHSLIYPNQNGNQLFIMREDLLPFSLGGNKVRIGQEFFDDMTEQAFDDQCTGANPRYPLFKEIKQMYLNAYYGNNSETV